MNKKKNINLIMAAILLIFICIVVGIIRPWNKSTLDSGIQNSDNDFNTTNDTSTTNGLKVTFLSTGKSDCIFITGNSFNMIIDAADSDDYSHISQLIDETGNNTIDYLVLTHLDKDHIGAASLIVEGYDVKHIIKPDYSENSDEYQALINAMSDKNKSFEILKENKSFEACGLTFTLMPPKEKSYDSDNDYSIITTMVGQKDRYLFMGDAEKIRLEEFMKDSSAVYDVVKIPHHGFDCNKTIKNFITIVAPKTCILTTSSESLADADLIKYIKKQESKVLGTYDGDIVLKAE